MSQEWLDYQGFIADHEVLQAITDLSIATKLELAGVASEEFDLLGARAVLERFFQELDSLQNRSAGDEPVVGDRNQREIAEAFRAARSDQTHYQSVLMRSGAKAGHELLAASDKPAKQALVDSLEELRQIVSGHQIATLSAIIEDF